MSDIQSIMKPLFNDPLGIAKVEINRLFVNVPIEEYPVIAKKLYDEFNLWYDSKKRELEKPVQSELGTIPSGYDVIWDEGVSPLMRSHIQGSANFRHYIRFYIQIEEFASKEEVPHFHMKSDYIRRYAFEWLGNIQAAKAYLAGMKLLLVSQKEKWLEFYGYCENGIEEYNLRAKDSYNLISKEIDEMIKVVDEIINLNGDEHGKSISENCE